jgi:glyoxylase-like metal-dependent hydrolase (beta-lactamase superfamily II)
VTTDQLVCFDLDQPGIEGFRKFISSWLVRSNGHTLLVDPGPLSTIPQLIAGLHSHAVTGLDYILLTHIHIDHAGGAGALLKQFPEARVICHPDGIRHLIAPEKLWLGSQQVLGELAGVYGEIVPVPAESIGYTETVGTTGVRAYLTPGHAQHHVSYLLGDLLFAGEVAGVRSECSGGIYMRPATPPRFLLPVAIDSIDRMIALAPDSMVFAHYGLVTNAREHLRIARRQLLLWVKGIAVTEGEEASRREDALLAWLVENDSFFGNISRLPEDIRAREIYFLGNSLRGMREYVDALTPAERRALTELQ